MRTLVCEMEERTRVLSKREFQTSDPAVPRARGGQQHLPRAAGERTHTVLRSPSLPSSRPQNRGNHPPPPLPAPSPQPQPPSRTANEERACRMPLSHWLQNWPRPPCRVASASGGTAAASGRPGAAEVEVLRRGRACGGGVSVGSRGAGARGAGRGVHGEEGRAAAEGDRSRRGGTPSLPFSASAGPGGANPG